MFPVFIQGRGANTMYFTPSQSRFQHIAGTNRTFSCTGAYHGMQFVDKDDNIFGLAQFFKNCFDALLKLATEHGTGNHAANI